MSKKKARAVRVVADWSCEDWGVDEGDVIYIVPRAEYRRLKRAERQRRLARDYLRILFGRTVGGDQTAQVILDEALEALKS
jgi:hypothetical protein